MKETNRIGALEQELAQLGIQVEAATRTGSWCTAATPQGATLKSHGDHRIAMCAAVAGLAADGRDDGARAGPRSRSRTPASKPISTSLLEGVVTARVVAIDGPSGSGKSTVGRGVAAAARVCTCSTPARCTAPSRSPRSWSGPIWPTPRPAVGSPTARRVELEDEIVRLDGEDVSARIRGPEVTGAVSTVSAHPEVRRELVSRQRAWVEQHQGGVVEGRDIGTVVFPDAPVKVFLTASDEERANRRHRDEQAAERSTAVDEVREALARRDALDSGRAASPLRAADDALVLDTTGRSIDDVVSEIVERFRAAVPEAT